MNFSTFRILCCGCAALVIFACVGRDTPAATIAAPQTDGLEQNTTTSAFFTASIDNTITFGASAGWAPTAANQAATKASVTSKKSFLFTGTATAPTWLNGNGVPTGITLAFDAELTVTALPTPNSLLTNPGSGTATSGLVGQGIGITPVAGGADDIDVPEGIGVSAVTVSNIVWSGSLSDPNYAFAPGSVSGFGTRSFRSSTFNEGTAGMILTQGASTIGFGTATGTIASNLAIENNLGNGSPASSVFSRQSGPYTLTTTQGVSTIKGIGLGYDITYDIIAVPEPATLTLVFVGLLATCFCRPNGRARS
jgi:hypothetical protein